MPRTKTITKEIYTFDELSDSAKEQARYWFRGCIDSNDYDAVIEDFVTVAEIIGVSFDTHSVQTMNGKTRQKPNIYWSGFCSQGDGACFEGEYRYAGDSCAKIREYCSDEELLRIADELNAIQTARILKGMQTVNATIRHSGRYYHEHSVDIDVEPVDGESLSDDEEFALGTASDEIAELMRDLMRWLYASLKRENDWLYSAECVDENIRANDYEFTEDGDIA